MDFSSAAQKAGLTQSEFDAVVISRVFDESFYLNTYPDIAAAGLNSLLHYLEHGRFEKRRASALFDPNVYVEINPGVLSSGVEPFLHYVLIGRTANAPRSHAEWVFRTLGCRLNQDELSKLSAAELSDVLSHFSEFTDVIKPLLDEIEHVFSTFVLRKPGAAELVASIAKFYETKTTWEDRRKAIAEKDIRKHLGIRPLRLEMDIVAIRECGLPDKREGFHLPARVSMRVVGLRVGSHCKTIASSWLRGRGRAERSWGRPPTADRFPPGRRR